MALESLQQLFGRKSYEIRTGKPPETALALPPIVTDFQDALTSINARLEGDVAPTISELQTQELHLDAFQAEQWLHHAAKGTTRQLSSPDVQTNDMPALVGQMLRADANEINTALFAAAQTNEARLLASQVISRIDNQIVSAVNGFRRAINSQQERALNVIKAFKQSKKLQGLTFTVLLAVSMSSSKDANAQEPRDSQTHRNLATVAAFLEGQEVINQGLSSIARTLFEGNSPATLVVEGSVKNPTPNEYNLNPQIHLAPVDLNFNYDATFFTEAPHDHSGAEVLGTTGDLGRNGIDSLLVAVRNGRVVTTEVDDELFVDVIVGGQPASVNANALNSDQLNDIERESRAAARSNGQTEDEPAQEDEEEADVTIYEVTDQSIQAFKVNGDPVGFVRRGDVLESEEPITPTTREIRVRASRNNRPLFENQVVVLAISTGTATPLAPNTQTTESTPGPSGTPESRTPAGQDQSDNQDPGAEPTPPTEVAEAAAPFAAEPGSPQAFMDVQVGQNFFIEVRNRGIDVVFDTKTGFYATEIDGETLHYVPNSGINFEASWARIDKPIVSDDFEPGVSGVHFQFAVPKNYVPFRSLTGDGPANEALSAVILEDDPDTRAVEGYPSFEGYSITYVFVMGTNELPKGTVGDLQWVSLEDNYSVAVQVDTSSSSAIVYTDFGAGRNELSSVLSVPGTLDQGLYNANILINGGNTQSNFDARRNHNFYTALMRKMTELNGEELFPFNGDRNE